MRVLHVAPSIARSYGGPTESLAGFAVASGHAGIEVSIAAPLCASDEADSFAARAPNAALHLFPAFGTGAFVISPTLLRWVARFADGYDAVHVHGLFNPISSFGARAALRRGGALVIRPFGTLSRYTFQHRRTALKNIYFSMIERQNLLGAAALHFTTTTERDDAAWHGIDFVGRSHVVPPPAHRDVARPANKRTGAEPATVLFLGRIVPVKNLECLLDAWTSVRRSNPGAILVVAGTGDGPYVASLRRRATAQGFAASVKFRGFVSGAEKEDLLASASVLVLPSLHENFGMSVIESIHAGVPVVISPEVQLAEFVRRHQMGKVVPSDPSLLAKAILDVLSDDALTTHTRRHGAEVVGRYFSFPVIGQLLSEMYRSANERVANRPSVSKS